MIAIVESRADRASEHICERLRVVADWEQGSDDDRPDAEGGGTVYRREGFELRSFDRFHLHTERAAAAFDDPDLLVFASRHSGETGPLLTAHFTGNFGPAEFGGRARDLAQACPNALAAVDESLRRHAPEGYDVGIECTHHGPTEVGCPSMFVEVGSGEDEWDDPEAATAVARAILDIEGVDPGRERTVVGFGGGHYAPRFTRILRETPWTVGHLAAEWALEELGDYDVAGTRSLLDRAFERSGGGQSAVERAVIDGDYPHLAATIEDLGYEVVSETWIREVGDRPLALVDRVEAELGSVDEGVRFGERGDDGDRVGERGDGSPEFEVRPLPVELLAEAQGIDADAARRAVEANTVAFRTREGGTRATDRAAFPAAGADPDGDGDPEGNGDLDGSEAFADLVDALADVLREAYEAVDRDPGAVVATETAFDPERAHELGVPEGPKFGRLAGGEAVTVDGEEIDPDEVHERRTRRFSVPEE